MGAFELAASSLGCLDMLVPDISQVTAQMSSSERPLLITLLKVACFSLTNHYLITQFVCLE